mmetsp:Transcript_14753/g.24581  ORF Transcript_14753/g.24581 Transcript_14753/m.24581 type:complete len:123 (-) Transcript_14753:125-493(-)
MLEQECTPTLGRSFKLSIGGARALAMTAYFVTFITHDLTAAWLVGPVPLHVGPALVRAKQRCDASVQQRVRVQARPLAVQSDNEVELAELATDAMVIVSMAPVITACFIFVTGRREERCPPS